LTEHYNVVIIGNIPWTFKQRYEMTIIGMICYAL